MIKHGKLLLLVFILGCIFVAHRAKQYFDDRKSRGHDTYEIIVENRKKCPDMDMFGFKYSVILCLALLNLFATIVLIFSLKTWKI